MARLTITIPDDLLAFATEMARAQDLDLSGLITLLVEQDRRARERLIAAIDEGEASGVSDLTFDEIIEAARERARSRAA